MACFPQMALKDHDMCERRLGTDAVKGGGSADSRNGAGPLGAFLRTSTDLSTELTVPLFLKQHDVHFSPTIYYR